MWENSHKVYLSWKVHKSVVSTIYRLSKEINLGEKELKIILFPGFTIEIFIAHLSRISYLNKIS